jgi:hypothetical protein
MRAFPREPLRTESKKNERISLVCDVPSIDAGGFTIFSHARRI